MMIDHVFESKLIENKLIENAPTENKIIGGRSLEKQ